jgi:hypothetical protein
MTKSLISLIFLCISHTGGAQEYNSTNWIEFTDEYVQTFIASKSQLSFQIDCFSFEIIWDDKLVLDEVCNTFMGGITKLEIYKDGHLINTIEDMIDIIGLGEIYFDFYDFNMDGHLDFRYPISMGKSRWDRYFLFNSSKNQFQYRSKWEGLRIQKVNKKDKLILSQPDGIVDNRKIFAVKGNRLIVVKKFDN